MVDSTFQHQIFKLKLLITTRSSRYLFSINKIIECLCVVIHHMRTKPPKNFDIQYYSVFY